MDKLEKNKKYKFDICLWLAEGKTTRQIVDMLKDVYNIDMSFANIDITYRGKPEWKKVTNYLRTRYLNNISRIPIAKKAHRLRLLHQAAEECLKWRIKSINKFGEIQEIKVGALPAIIAEARKEVEGERPLADFSTHLHFTTIKEAIENASINGSKARDRVFENTESSRELAE